LEIAAYLQKPVRQSQLYNCLSAIITEATASAETRQSPRLITQHTLGQASREKKVTVDSTVKVRILVAEDNIVNQKVALKQLQSLGYAADIVPNGREAIEAVKNHSYDVVLMDCQMPIADGFEATATIRQHEGEAKHMIIIAMTAHALEGEREKCLAAGMDDYISKPVKIDILGEMLKKWLARDAENLEEAQAEKLATTINMDNFESVDTAVLGGFKDLQQPDESDIVTELIDLFLEDAEKRMTVLKQSADGDDVKMISTQAHAIKGSSGNIGAVKIAMLSNLLEEKTIDISRARLIISELEAEFEKVARILKAMRKSDS